MKVKSMYFLYGVLALVFSTNVIPLNAAASELYAVVNDNIFVYEVSRDGGLGLECAVSSPEPFGELAITPDGQFLYAARAGEIVEYTVARNGCLRQEGVPFRTRSNSPGIGHILVDPSGGHLFAMDGVSVQVHNLAINEQNGHLSLVNSISTGVESGALATDPEGSYLFASRTGGAGCGPGGGITTFQIAEDGTLRGVSNWTNNGQEPRTSAPSKRDLNADTRFVYLFTSVFCNTDDPPATVVVFRIGENGTLAPLHVYPWLATGKKVGRFLAVRKDGGLYTYLVDHNGNLRLRDTAAVDPVSLTGNANGSRVFVSTSDQIFVFHLIGNGHLKLESETAAPSASNLLFRP